MGLRTHRVKNRVLDRAKGVRAAGAETRRAKLRCTDRLLADRRTFQACQDILKGRSRRTGKPEHPCAGGEKLPGQRLPQAATGQRGCLKMLAAPEAGVLE